MIGATIETLLATSPPAILTPCHSEERSDEESNVLFSRPQKQISRGARKTQPGRSKLRLYGVVACFFICASPLFARSWHISDFNDDISVNANGTTTVHERITAVFAGQFHGIYRNIPIEYPGPSGTNYTLFLSVKGVTDENGHSLKYESSRKGDYRDLKIYIPGAEDATRTIEIHYVLRNAVRFFSDHDEFYWNVTGNDWPVPIDHATALVTFPDAASGSLRAQAFTGVYGSKSGEATSKINGSDATFETTSPLPMRGGLTIDVYLPKGILHEPSSFTRFLWFIGSNPIVFLPFVTFGVMFVLWWYKGRDPDPGQSVAPMYEPPPGMSPAEAGTLLDDAVHPRDITSTIVDLAVRGYIKIEETVQPGVFFHHKDYIFHLLKPKEQWKDLAPHESVMLENIYAGGGSETRLSSLKNHFYTAIPVIREDIMSSLRQKGMYLLDPESANGYSLAAILVIVAPFVIVQVVGWKDVFSSIGLLVLCGLISAVIWWLFAREMTAKTIKGGRTRVAVLGFEEFMKRVDADRLKRMPPDTFEKFLPYAMALGVEHQWAQAFAGIVKDPPSWYASPNGFVGFNPLFFAASMNSMATDMNQVFVSAPRASSTGSGWGGGGGFGGGGFSGGGFGGGGGGAF